MFIGEDLDVMLALCDKIMVLCHGKNMGIVHANKVTKEEIDKELIMSFSLNYQRIGDLIPFLSKKSLEKKSIFMARCNKNGRFVYLCIVI